MNGHQIASDELVDLLPIPSAQVRGRAGASNEVRGARSWMSSSAIFMASLNCEAASPTGPKYLTAASFR
jgi:hypothetical protein